MSGIVAESARVENAFDRPTLRLLQYKWAPVALAVLRSGFSRDRRNVPAERLHSQVTTLLDELAASGRDVPTETGRQLCLTWMRGQWLNRTAGQDGEEYSLTSHALEALEIISSMSQERALLSESRLATIISAARRCAIEASEDTTRRLAIIDAQISELTTQRALIASGVDKGMNGDRLIDEVASLQDLLRQMPSDFKRVEESMFGMNRQLLAKFRDDDRPVGQVAAEYLSSSVSLIQDTPEGRAFNGALELLRDEDLLGELRGNLNVVLDHPKMIVLTANEHRELETAVGAIRQGTVDVLSVRHRLSSTLREHVVVRETASNMELDRVLRVIESELVTWMGTARKLNRVPVRLLPDRFTLDSLRTRFWNPADSVLPPPLDDTTGDAPEPSSLDYFRKLGGPTVTALHDLLDTTDRSSAADAFNTLPEDLRRPVEIVGLVHALDSTDRYATLDGTETYRAVRPDGTHVTFTVPRIPLGIQPGEEPPTGLPGGTPPGKQEEETTPR